VKTIHCGAAPPRNRVASSDARESMLDSGRRPVGYAGATQALLASVVERVIRHALYPVVSVRARP
jgi:hypothetical protein